MRPDVADRSRFNDARDALLGSECAQCGVRSWPRRWVCHRCSGRTLSVVELARTGLALACTTVFVGRAGLPSPYILCEVELDRGPRVYGQLRLGDEAEVSTPLQVRIEVDPDPAAMPRFRFIPDAA